MARFAPEEAPMLDVLITGGTLVDGTGSPARRGDLGIRGGRIAAVGEVSEGARETIDARGKVGHEATPAELDAMRELLAASLREGGLGFSSTISPTHNDAQGQPVPSRHASRAELIALARVVRDFPGTTLEFLPGVTVFSDE